MATVVRSADPVCPLREAAGRRQRHTRNPDRERYIVASAASRRYQPIRGRGQPF
jgi:hypothetical protein